LIDFFGILVILFVIFGSSIMPGIGAAIGRRLARSKRKAARAVGQQQNQG